MIQITMKPGVWPGLAEFVSAHGFAFEQRGAEFWGSPGAQALVDAFTQADACAFVRGPKIEAIKAERDRRKFAGYMAAGNRFHSDPDSRTQQLGLVIMGAGVPPIQWRTLDGTYVTMTQQLAAAIFTATAMGDAAIFAAGEAHRAAVEAMTDPMQIEAYDFSGGWPEV